jgi:hypothetical protein
MTDAHQAARAKLLDGAPVLSHGGTNYAAFLEPDIADQRQRCKCCGAPLEGSTPARPEAIDVLEGLRERPIDDQQMVADTLADLGTTPATDATWHDREKML